MSRQRATSTTNIHLSADPEELSVWGLNEFVHRIADELKNITEHVIDHSRALNSIKNHFKNIEVEMTRLQKKVDELEVKNGDLKQTLELYIAEMDYRSMNQDSPR